jgi:hypothetical protein
MNIRETHNALAALLGGLSITAPVPLEMRRTWKFFPPANHTISETPCSMQSFTLTDTLFRPAGLVQRYEVWVQILAHRVMADGDIAADVAAAFLDAFIRALSDNQLLDGTVSVMRNLRGEQPTLTTIQWGKVAYVAVDLRFDIELHEAKEHSP